MKKKIEIAAFFVICAMVITLAVKAGQHHEKCANCNIAVNTK